MNKSLSSPASKRGNPNNEFSINESDSKSSQSELEIVKGRNKTVARPVMRIDSSDELVESSTEKPGDDEHSIPESKQCNPNDFLTDDDSKSSQSEIDIVEESDEIVGSNAMRIESADEVVESSSAEKSSTEEEHSSPASKRDNSNEHFSINESDMKSSQSKLEIIEESDENVDESVVQIDESDEVVESSTEKPSNEQQQMARNNRIDEIKFASSKLFF